MRSIFKISRPISASRPPVAVELAPEGLLAATVSGSQMALSFAPLLAGVVEPGIAEANLKNPSAIAAALSRALGELNPQGKALTLVVPDSAVRVFVLDFDAFPSRRDEALPVLRFRLRKMVPFEVEVAGIGFQKLSESKTECRVLAVVIPQPVLAEYEQAIRAVGYEPGIVLPSTLAALGAVEGNGPALVVSLSAHTLTTAIVQANDLLLYRTVDLPADEAPRTEEIRRGIAVTSAYYEDKLITPPTKLLFIGPIPAAEFARILDEPTLAVTELVERPATGAATPLGAMSIAALTGVLKGAA